MTTVFRLPDLGEGLTEAEIVSWHVGIGDHVVIDQPLVSIETEKAVVEIPSPYSGRITALHGAPGDLVAVGAPLVEFAEAPAADAGAIVGDIGSTGGRVERETLAPPPAATAGARVEAAPAVRRLAAARGVDLSRIAGTGVGGSVTQADVEAASAQGAGTKVRGVRRAMLANMVRAGHEVVPATVTDQADIECWARDSDVTVRLIRAVVAGCRASPSLNAWFDAASETRTLHQHVDLGIAVETDDGLFAPVVRDAASMTAGELRAAIDAIKAGIADRSIARAALSGQTITLSNFGMFGGRYADLVVVPPQVAILGAGRATREVVAVDGAPAVHRLLPLSLSFDHRVVTGVEAARFLNAVVGDLEKPD